MVIMVLMMMKSYVASSNLQRILRGKIEEGYYFTKSTYGGGKCQEA